MSTAGPARRRRLRWAVPVAAVAAAGMVIAGSVIARGQAAPALPARSTAQLLAAVDRPSAFPASMTAVVQENASLGLPDLPTSSDPLSGVSLLSGSHTFTIWYDGPRLARVALPVTMGEADLRKDGSSVWLWDSRTNQATHYLLPAGATPAVPSAPATAVPTPPQLARQILAAVGATTTVRLARSVTVAGQPAYQLTLAPKDGRSLIGRVQIAIDAKNSLPLQVQVFARGAAGPAFSVGYTSLSFARPAASNFAFSPPPGAKVKTVRVPAGPAHPGVWTGTAPTARSAAYSSSLSVTIGKPGSGTGWTAYAPLSSAPSSAEAISATAAVPTTVGKGWLTVAVLPAGGLGVQGLAPGSGGAESASIAAALLGAATPVRGAWGSGRLLQTSLFSALLLSDGRVLIGAVKPAVLYADAARLR